MKPYVDQLNAHLAEYKRNALGVREDGLFRNNGQPYGHILPEALQQLNILEPYRFDFWQYYRENAKELASHTHFHHLNSSQAFGFNLLFPFVADPELAPLLLNALDVHARAWSGPQFEYMPDQAEGTTVDFTIELDGTRRLLIEVKLTESAFGSCVPNEAHRHKLANTYSRLLAGKVKDGSLEEAHFFQYYQLYRNVAYVALDRGDRLVLLLPRANTLTWQQGETFIRDRLLEDVKAHVSLVAAEDVVSRILADPRCTYRLRAQYDRLRDKYFPA